MNDHSLIDWFRNTIPQLTRGVPISRDYLTHCCGCILQQLDSVRLWDSEMSPEDAADVRQELRLMLDFFEVAAAAVLAWLEDGDGAHLARALKMAEEGWDQASMVKHQIQQGLDAVTASV